MESATPEQTEATILPFPSPLFDYTKAKQRIDKLIGEWSGEVEKSKQRRKERYVDLDVEALRQSGDIDEDSTLIPDRVIDNAITREKADIMGFLTGGFRLAIFDCISRPDLDCRDLEIQVTKGWTYDGWYSEFEMCEDGAQLHKMAYIEVVLDTSKPLFVGFEYIQYDKLFYNKKVSNIQQSEFVLREYEINPFVLETWAERFGFDGEQIKLILKEHEDSKRDNDIKIYKLLFKHAGAVCVAWYTKEGAVRNWLKAPQPLDLGIVDIKTLAGVPVDSYPIFTRLYRPDENSVLVEHYGRWFFDGPQQEANTAIITSYVNNLLRSSNFYASPSNADPDSNAEMKQLDIKLTPGAVMSNPLNFWSLPPPDVMTLNAINFFDSRNAAQQGKTAFTVMNRDDSRKTKKELDIAEQEQAKITNMPLANFSSFLRSVLVFAWRITQSQALLNRIPLLLIPVPLMPGNPELGMRWVNDKDKLSQTFDVRPAGDTDILQAEVETGKMRMDWPVMQTTALKDKFLEDYIKLQYPRKASEYIAILKAGNMVKQLVATQAQIIDGAIKDLQAVGKASPNDLAFIQQTQQQAQQFLATP